MSAASELQKYLCIPPQNFNGNPNSGPAVAHAALEALRDSGDERFLFLRTLLELRLQAAQHEELLFHCLTGLRQALLQRWPALNADFYEVVRDYLLTLGQDETLPRTIKLACFTTAASFWKRHWNETNRIAGEPLNPDEQTLVNAMMQEHPVRLRTEQELFQYLETIFPPPGTGSLFLSILVGEFMGKSAVQYHLPLEFHKRAHASFEKDGWLDQSLSLSMGALSQIVSHIERFTENSVVVVQLTIDIISWEFGSEAWQLGIPVSGKSLVRPPVSWSPYLVRPDFIGAMFSAHEAAHTQSQLAHSFRQLLLLLASLQGHIFETEDQRVAFATYLVDGTLKMLSLATSTQAPQPSELLDSLAIVSRLIANFKLSTLVKLPSLGQLLGSITNTGAALLHGNVKDCESLQGDVESMDHREWREEALCLVLEGCVLLSDDPWLLFSGSEESRKHAQLALASTLAPLYNAFITSRIKMARMEEYYLTANAADLDEVREQISATDLEEEMTSVASLGRLNLSASLACLSALFQSVSRNLETLWETSHSSEVSPDGAALLEETRLLTLSLGHLLTDDNTGETPVIPECIIIACQANSATTDGIVAAVQSIMTLAQVQASKLARNTSDSKLSPLLATSILWFLNRWAPAYILPLDYGSTDSATPSQILSIWGSREAANQAICFCTTLCQHYQCYWPQEKQVQEKSSKLLMQLAKRGQELRSILVGSPSFQQMAAFHCVTAGLRHGAPTTDLEAIIDASAATTSPALAKGYQRLPYDDRSQILTAMLVATCDNAPGSTASAMFSMCLASVQNAFQHLVQALISKTIAASHVDAKEMASLCVEMYCGVARASDVTDPDRVIQFMTPALQDLSGLMDFYAQDLGICESILRLFRDYTEFFVALLNKDQSLVLFRAAADLLKSYSTQHCATRIVSKLSANSIQSTTEEEQSYSDVLCAIQLLIHLGTKDFLDICSATSDGIDSGSVTDIIFFGLEQIIPLMTQGLLQFPTLCIQYFSLVGFMMDTYPDKVCVLPYDLFISLLESLLFGMSHIDSFVCKSSLQGIAGIAKEHIQTHALSDHLAVHPDIFDNCARRLLKEVVFQSIVWDRLESSGMALLPLAAVDVNRFVHVVNGIAQQVPSEQQPQLRSAFEKLIQPEILSMVTKGGYEGRMNRIKFKKNFEFFVKDIHSFVVVK